MVSEIEGLKESSVPETRRRKCSRSKESNLGNKLREELNIDCWIDLAV